MASIPVRAGRRSKAGLHKWAAEVAAQGSFSAPFSPDDAGASLGGLPVPHLVIGTKADISGGHDTGCGYSGWLQIFVQAEEVSTGTYAGIGTCLRVHHLMAVVSALDCWAARHCVPPDVDM